MRVKLEEVCHINMGQSPSSSTYNEKGMGLPFFQGNADFGELHPSVRVWCSSPTKTANVGDILISVRAPIGAMNIADCSCCIGRGLAALTVDYKKIETKFLWYYLNYNIEELKAKGTGSTFKAINRKALEETEIPLPPLPEQRRIAAVLDKVSELIALRKKQLALLDEMVKARFVEMFGTICESEYKVLIDVCTLITDGTHNPPDFVDKGIPFLLVSNIRENRITYDTHKFITEETYNQLMKRTPIEKGDVLLSTVGSYGHPAIVNSDKKFSFQRHIAQLKPNHKIINSVFLHSAILSPSVQRQINSLVLGVAQKTLNLSAVKTIKIPVPSISKQTQFADFVQQVEKSKTTVQQALEKLELLKSALMQAYFG